MAINAYCGIMGSGKSYEVVSGPLLDAVAAGRRVVTNIDGIDEEKVHSYLVEKRSSDPAKLGRIVRVTTARVAEEGFFPVENESSKEGEAATVTPGFVEPGDFVVIDEGWKLWAAGEKLLPSHVAFFRMHRHFVHPVTHIACDVAIMVQSIGDMHRMIKPVFELTFVMVKLKVLGQSRKYRVEMYEGWKQNKKTRIGTYIKSYKKEIFPLYKSYAGGAGKEAVIDKRQNVLMNPKLWGIAIVLVLCGLVGFWAVWKFFHPTPKTPVQSAAAAASGSSAPSAGSIPSPAAAPAAPKSEFSSDWRVAGRFEANGLSYVVLADAAGRLRVDSPGGYNGVGASTVGKVDGSKVSMWSGSKPVSSGVLPERSSK